VDRDGAAADRDRVLADARREAQALISAAQKSAQELRDADIAATREELERLRVKAASDIAAERDRALADLRAQVADLALAAAGKVVGETMTDARQRRLVDEFLAGDGSAQGRQN
jgi:F-type H+-transporting ATPase subunit b